METFHESGLGVYVEPVIDLASHYVNESNIINLTGQSSEQLYHSIDVGSPVWMFTNIWFTLLLEEGPMQVTYLQHCVVLTGYDEEYVYINDPLQMEKHIALSRNDIKNDRYFEGGI